MRQVVTAAVIAATLSTSAYAAVSAEEAKQLGTTLTPWGAEKNGNKEGTIPAYAGEKLKLMPPGSEWKKQGLLDPWGDKPLFSITAQNAAQYADKLDGTLTMFKKYPGFRMDIYPSHRTAMLSKQVQENTIKNATSCKGADDEMKLADGVCFAGYPFPIPKTGRQVMWNRLMNPGEFSFESQRLRTWVIPANGQPVLQSENLIYQEYAPYDPVRIAKPMKSEDLYYHARVDTSNPPRAAGQKFIFQYSLDPQKGQRAWAYIPGQRRVKLSPDLTYDTPSPLSGGSQLMDEGNGFTGALDRFDYKLVGKKEKFILYNNIALTDPRTCGDNKVLASKGFANADCVRWELHRVWEVEATLRPGFRHVYKRRMYFWDEDTYQGTSEGYDGANQLYRLYHVVTFPLPDGGWIGSSTIESDLQTGIWTYQGSMGVEGAVWLPNSPKGPLFYTPEALAGEGVR